MFTYKSPIYVSRVEDCTVGSCVRAVWVKTPSTGLRYPSFLEEGVGKQCSEFGVSAHSEHRFPARWRKDVVNQCLEFGVSGRDRVLKRYVTRQPTTEHLENKSKFVSFDSWVYVSLSLCVIIVLLSCAMLLLCYYHAQSSLLFSFCWLLIVDDRINNLFANLLNNWSNYLFCDFCIFFIGFVSSTYAICTF